MMLHTDDVVWSFESHARGLRDFLLYLTAATRPGEGTIGVETDAGRTWLSTLDAETWIHRAHDAWQDDSGDEATAFKRLSEFSTEVFLDHARMLACIQDRLTGHERQEAITQVSSQEHLWFGLAVTWQINGPRFTPQWRISNFRPSSSWFAPPGPAETPRPSSAEEATDSLFGFWDPVETALRTLKRSFGLGGDDARVNGNVVTSPVHYFAEPTGPLTDIYASGASGIRHLRPLTLGLLNAADPTNPAVRWGSFPGRLLIGRSSPNNQVSYILIPTEEPGTSIAELAEVEERVVMTADELSFVWDRGMIAVHDLSTDIDRLANTVDTWGWILDEVIAVAERVRVLGSRGEAEARHSSYLTDRLQLMLAEFDGPILTAAGDAATAQDEFEADIEDSIAIAEMGELHSSEIPGTRPLLISELGPHALLADRLKRLAGQSSHLVELLRSLELSLDRAAALIESERKLREERQRQRLNLFLGLVAGFAVVPLIIGQNDWDATQAAIARFPMLGSGMAGVLNALQPVLSSIALVAASVVLGWLIWLLYRTSRPAEDRERWKSEWPNDEAVAIAEAWEHNRRATDATTTEVDARDDRACRRLLLIDQWLELHDFQQMMARQDPSATGDELQGDIALLSVTAALFCRRPRSINLPLALAMLRYRRFGFDALEAVLPSEFADSLGRLGFTEDEQAAIEAWAVKLEGLRTADWLTQMRAAGVRAGRTSPIVPPSAVPS